MRIGDDVRAREHTGAELVDVAPRGDVEGGGLDDGADRVDRLERATGPGERHARAGYRRHDHVDRGPMPTNEVEPRVETHPGRGQLRRGVRDPGLEEIGAHDLVQLL